jgi:MFS family permease
MTVGMALAAGGLIYFAQISPHGTYLGTLLPGFLLAGVGLGLSFVPVTIGAMSGVIPGEAGVASGLITTTQQIGGALGVAVLSTIAVSATTRFIDGHGHAQGVMTEALNHGFSIAFWVGAVFAGIGCLIAFFGMVGLRPTEAPASGEATEEQRTAFEPASS